MELSLLASTLWLLKHFRNRAYYAIKPLIPRAARMAGRRFFADRKRVRIGDIWPICPGSEKTPAGWPGWPMGKQFAFVLTHDVEGVEGLKKVTQTAELEMSMGFRSSFNFIPEGGYQVPSELRHWLVSNGFEVGVHDLKHDGHLFSNRREFERSVPRINACIQEWNAKGFRGGFMLRNLDWLHELNIQYDTSTFDTDPFEPQPDGVGTIFPFWVDNPAAPLAEDRDSKPQFSPQFTVCGPKSTTRRGYVELPFTLPQDSTLFLLLREQSAEIWESKLDWVAKNGGMALLNVHPDYLGFNGAIRNGIEYPAAYYEQFLKTIKARYDGRFWHALPKEVDRFCREILAGGPQGDKPPALPVPKDLGPTVAFLACCGPVIC